MKISVITVVRNRRDVIGSAIESTLGQDYTDLEYLIVDGASTDGTLDVIRGYDDSRIRLISEPDEGIYDALNKGIAAATGDVIGLMHSDDCFADGAVLSDIAALFRRDGGDAVYGDLDYVSKASGRIIRRWRAGIFRQSMIARGWMPPHPTLYLKKSVFETYGRYDPRYRIAADYDFILRILKPGGLKCSYLPRVLVRMRQGGVSNRSLASIMRKMTEDYWALRANRVGGAASLFLKNSRKLLQFLPSIH